MNGTEIRRLHAEDAAEYQALFLGALQSAPTAFAADYGEESARSSDQIAERIRREVIFGAFGTDASVQSQHSCSKPPQGFADYAERIGKPPKCLPNVPG